MLRLVEQLKSALRDFAGREERLQREHRQRLAAERERCEAEAAGDLARWRQEAGSLTSALPAARAQLEARHQSRASRIAAARKSAERHALARIEEREGRRRYELQREMMRAQRGHDEGLAAAAAACEQFKADLAVEHDALAQVENDARAMFKGSAGFARLLNAAGAAASPAAGADEHQLFAELRKLVEDARAEVGRFRRRLLPWVSRHWFLWVVLLGLIAAVPLLGRVGVQTVSFEQAGMISGGAFVMLLVLHFVARSQAAPAARKVAGALGKARRLHDACLELADARHQREHERITGEFASRTGQLNADWNAALAEAEDARQQIPLRTEEKAGRALRRNESARLAADNRLALDSREAMGQLHVQIEAREKSVEKTRAAAEERVNTEFDARWNALAAAWNAAVGPVYDAIQAANAAADQTFPPWDSAAGRRWSPPGAFARAAKFARLEVDATKLADAAPKDPRLALPGPAQFVLPVQLAYPGLGSALFETNKSGRAEAIGALNNLTLRLLSVAPPGRLSFTIFDPVELGQNFAGVMHLADHADHLVNSRIWTQAAQIEQRLADLNEHMEKVIQMYLRNEYATIAEYNEQAGNIAEKYHFLVIADFPANFSDTALKRLMSIAASGARCGVYTLIHWDQRHPVPPDFPADELRRSGVSLASRGGEFIFTGKQLPGTKLLLDAPPAPEVATEFIHTVGRANKDSNRVEVPFDHVAPPDAGLWTVETTSELRVPIGRTGATKLQYLAIGKGTRQHALIAGKTGSGKSTLFHVIVTNLALWCRPEEVEFYLVDFKKGVEFKCYATHRLPHARVVAIESDREFGLSVLQRVDEELKRRGDLFRQAGAQDLAGYKRAGGKEPMPRSLLLIDEFQEFFVEEDQIAQAASVLLDRIVRQGRAFGIHVILGSQTLGGAYTVARTTLGQMVVRIALQCNEADAYLIMDDNNPAPRLLSRPGEGIYNDAAGAKEGNSPFQVVWLPDDVRDRQLARARQHADRAGTAYHGPIVFEGDAPADVRENVLLTGLLEAAAFTPGPSARIWLGAPNSIKGPTEAVFHRQAGNHLLMVGQRDEAVLAILSVALVSLAAQHPRGAARFVVLDGSPAGSPAREHLERLARALPQDVTLAGHAEVAAVMGQLADELKQRVDRDPGATAPAVFLLIHGLQQFKKLRQEDEFGFSGDADAGASPAAQLNNLITEGAAHGIHVIATCDTLNNVNRFLNRKAISEFELRVLFQMSANDSATLIDSPKAGSLGLHRALLYNEREGSLELFRPYALPGRDWIEAAAANLRRRAGAAPA
jgi:hypothetical protein